MKIKLLIATAIVMLTAFTSAEAQDRRGSVGQHGRIRQGVRSGEITRHERRELGMRERHLRHDRRRAHADGVVTHRERREIRKDRRHNSRAIYRKKHNRRDRY